ncbi:MAG: hypothetical protein MUC40_08380 [Akkermansiaceae bacterium]|nr:hypothetical protein [Akkermansiaceae bacterium]
MPCARSILPLASRQGRAHGVQELLEDAVQPLDLAARGGEVLLQRLALAGRQLAQLAA